ncbi:MAG TPA: UDP-N-acetylmuramoyl-L-alanine--D-glutamate ligase [Bacillota bacterium]|nr:UDP-N-acetylmuramoyl-L-alanine--D-glutamate ligase [Bacillota bacterium]
MGIKMSDLRNKKSAVMGLGLRSGVPLVRFLLDAGCEVTVFDRSTAEQLADVVQALDGLPVSFVCGDGYLDHLHGFDFLFRTPIMRPDLPEIETALAQGAVLSSEIELIFDLCRAPITAVTGSDGKTTTTSLIYEILKHNGRQVYLGGNIGRSLIEEVLEIPATAEVILELSSFQLMTMRQSPAVAVMTNLSPNHLDVHASYEEYTQAKANIWRWQSPEDIAVFNLDDELTRAMSAEAAGQVYHFSRRGEPRRGVFVRGTEMLVKGEDDEQHLLDTSDLKLKGVHNWENAAAAACACLARGVGLSDVADALRSFTGVEHRLELVRELNGVFFYNDSIASSPTRTIAGIHAVGGDLVLIAGGSDKYVSFDSLAETVVDRVRAVALIGVTAGKIDEAIERAEAKSSRRVQRVHCSSMAEALDWCRATAVPGTSVMLSPACASFDMFKNFEDRGRQFKDLVQAL